MKFTKMQGLGNDYIYINCFDEDVVDPSSLSIRLSDRHFGVGSDGIVLIQKSDVADFRMRMFNPDGTEAEICGNASRCIGKYVYEKKLTDKTYISLESLAGIKYLKLNVKNGIVESITVDMGKPILDAKLIPVNTPLETFVNQEICISDKKFNATCVSMGNPHVIVYVSDVENFPVSILGKQIEKHDLFPKRANVEFIEIIDKSTLKMRVWERGTGETLACGTGACASTVASYLNGISNNSVTVKLLGGDLSINWNQDDNHVYMTGPAEFVFEGTI